MVLPALGLPTARSASFAHRWPLLLALCAALPLVTAGCSKEYVRGSDDPSVDHAAMGTGLDKVDIQKLLKACLDDLRVHPIMADWRAAGQTNVQDKKRSNLDPNYYLDL